MPKIMYHMLWWGWEEVVGRARGGLTGCMVIPRGARRAGTWTRSGEVPPVAAPCQTELTQERLWPSSPRYPAGACAGAAPDWLCDGKLKSITQLVLCDGNLAACLQTGLTAAQDITRTSRV